MGKTDPRLYKRTLASAGMSCVVVTNTFTQLLLELMMERDLSAWVSQESVRASTSARSCSQASLLAGPSRPETQHKNAPGVKLTEEKAER